MYLRDELINSIWLLNIESVNYSVRGPLKYEILDQVDAKHLEGGLVPDIWDILYNKVYEYTFINQTTS